MENCVYLSQVSEWGDLPRYSQEGFRHGAPSISSSEVERQSTTTGEAYFLVGQKLGIRLAAKETSGVDQPWDWEHDAQGHACSYVGVAATIIRRQGAHGARAEGRMDYVELCQFAFDTFPSLCCLSNRRRSSSVGSLSLSITPSFRINRVRYLFQSSPVSQRTMRLAQRFFKPIKTGFPHDLI